MKRPRIETFKFSSRAIRATNDCFTLIDNRGRLIRLFLQRFDKLIAMLFPRDKLLSRIQSSGMLRQIMLHLLHVICYLFL